MESPLIRDATREDIRGMLEAQHSAVHEIAAMSYSPEICQDWSPPVTAQRIDLFDRELFSACSIIVAEVQGRIVGYAAVLCDEAELRDLYVSARFGGRGIGGKLLRAVERVAQKCGCRVLALNATVTAEHFYIKHGYREIERRNVTLSSGRQISCIRMRKELIQ